MSKSEERSYYYYYNNAFFSSLTHPQRQPAKLKKNEKKNTQNQKNAKKNTKHNAKTKRETKTRNTNALAVLCHAVCFCRGGFVPRHAGCLGHPSEAPSTTPNLLITRRVVYRYKL